MKFTIRVMARWLVHNGADVNFDGPGNSFHHNDFTVAHEYSYPVTMIAAEDPFFLKLLRVRELRTSLFLGAVLK
jgi:hypothetical protein